MNLNKNKSGFTLLEIIIVIIIVGILASIALPKFFRTVEFSRSQEALISLGTMRQAMERCYLYTRSFVPCTGFGNLDVLDPGPGSHWTFSWPAPGANAYILTAGRTTLDGGSTSDNIQIDQSGSKTGVGNFSAIRGQ